MPVQTTTAGHDQTKAIRKRKQPSDITLQEQIWIVAKQILKLFPSGETLALDQQPVST